MVKKVLVLAERIKNNSAPDKFYKQTVQNISYLNEEKIFIMKNKRNIENKIFYWLKDTKNNGFLNKRFQRHNFK